MTIALLPGAYLLVSPIIVSGPGIVLSLCTEIPGSEVKAPMLSRLMQRTLGLVPRKCVNLPTNPAEEGVLLGPMNADINMVLLPILMEIGVPNTWTQLTVCS